MELGAALKMVHCGSRPGMVALLNR
jgi:hypothetical protein